MGRARRAVARVGVTAGIVLVAVALLVGVGTAAPTRVPAAGPLLGADDLARDQGVPVPDLPACLPTTRACVDLDGGRAWLLDGGRVVRGPVPVTPGGPDTPTPRGLFAVQWKAPTWTSREFLVQMPWSVFFADGGIAFHEGDLDQPSAGCVKLGADDARAFFEFLHVGDQVQVLRSAVLRPVERGILASCRTWASSSEPSWSACGRPTGPSPRVRSRTA